MITEEVEEEEERENEIMKHRNLLFFLEGKERKE